MPITSPGHPVRHNGPALAVLALLASACAATDDPREGGFFNGVGNLFSGGYERRIEREQAALDQEKTDKGRLDIRAASLQETRRQLDREVRTIERQISDLKKQVRAARRGLGDQPAAPQTNDLMQAETRLADLQARVQLAKLPDRSNDEVDRDLRTLRGEMTDLSTLVASLQ